MQKAVAPKIVSWGRPSILGPTLSKYAHFQSRLKVSRRSAEAARRYSAAKCQKKINRS